MVQIMNQEYESDEDNESLWKAETNHTYETLLYLLKEAMKFALVEDVTYLDPVHNLLTNKTYCATKTIKKSPSIKF